LDEKMALHVTALEWENIMGEGDWLASVLKIWKRMYFALAHSCDESYDFKYGMMLQLTEIIYGKPGFLVLQHPNFTLLLFEQCFRSGSRQKSQCGWI
jgi:hypothetical protein